MTNRLQFIKNQQGYYNICIGNQYLSFDLSDFQRLTDIQKFDQKKDKYISLSLKDWDQIIFKKGQIIIVLGAYYIKDTIFQKYIKLEKDTTVKEFFSIFLKLANSKMSRQEYQLIKNYYFDKEFIHQKKYKQMQLGSVFFEGATIEGNYLTFQYGS